jgi:hypothetical protein
MPGVDAEVVVVTHLLTPAAVGPGGIPAGRGHRPNAAGCRVPAAPRPIRPADHPRRTIAEAIPRACQGRSTAISRPSAPPRITPRRGPLIPPLMGPPRGGGPTGAPLRRSPPDRLIARRWASFVGPLRAKSWRADDWAGPAGRARIRAHPRNQFFGSGNGQDTETDACSGNPSDALAVRESTRRLWLAVVFVFVVVFDG